MDTQTLVKAMARENLALYAKMNLRGPPEPPYNGKFVAAKHHVEWADLVNRHKHLLLLASRSSGKSWFFSFAFLIWCAERMPGARGTVFNGSDDMAAYGLKRIREEIETNPNLEHLLPKDRKMWNAHTLQFGTGFELSARGMLARSRGLHPHVVICDDILNDDTMISVEVKKQQTNFFYGAIEPMLEPGGQIIVIGCVRPDTWIYTANGLRQIGTLCPGEMRPQTLYDLEIDVFAKDGVRRASKFWVNGEAKTKRLTLRRGYSVEGTDRHPVLVMGENGVPAWRRLDEIEVGDWVALHSGLNAWGEAADLKSFKAVKRDFRQNELKLPDTLTEDLAYLLGLWTAEGSFEPSGRVNISNTDESIREWLLSHPFGLNFKANTTEDSTQTLRASAKTFLELIEHLGGHLGTASTKIVPRAIMEGSRENARAFLQGYFDGDGCATIDRAGSIRVNSTSVSRRLSEEIHLLLLNFGIVATLRTAKLAASERVKNPRHVPHRVDISGPDAVRFLTEIGFRLARKQSILVDAKSSPPGRRIPLQGAVIATMRSEKPDWRKEHFAGTLPPPPMSITQVARDPSVHVDRFERAVSYLESLGSRGFGLAAAQENIRAAKAGRLYLQVESIEDSSAFTVDLVVPDGESFIGNGIVCHNTPMTSDDLLATIEEKGGYHVGKYPAIDEQGNLLWPERLTHEYLAHKRQTQGEIIFDREYRCKPASDTSSLFPSRFYNSDDPLKCPKHIEFGRDRRYYQQFGVTQFYMGVDFAFSSEIGADFSVITTIGVDREENVWLVDIQRTKGLGYEEQKALIKSAASRFNPNKILCEANQAQRIFGDELRRQTQLPVDKYVTTQDKHRLDKGVPSLRPIFENGKIRIPSMYPNMNVDQWKREMQGVTIVDGRVVTTTKHDDCCMSFFFAVQAYKSCQGFTFFFDTQEGDMEALKKDRERLKNTTDEDYLGLGLTKSKLQAELQGQSGYMPGQPAPVSPQSWLGFGPAPGAIAAPVPAERRPTSLSERPIGLFDMFDIY